MNFNVDPNYLNSVQTFVFADYNAAAPLSISSTDLTAVVKEVSLAIITASQLKPLFSQMASKELSLRDVCFIVAQESDKKEKKNTVANIENASQGEKVILSHTIHKLSQDFTQVTKDDLNVVTLLFGIQRIHQFASAKIIDIEMKETEIRQMEEALAQLIAVRSQYSTANANETTQAFLAKVDAKIKEQSDLLATLKASLEKTA
jgi:hypothetical protein